MAPEERENDSQNRKLLTWAELDHVVPVEKKTLNHQIFIVGCLLFVKNRNLHAALCSNRYGSLTLTRSLHSWMSMGENAIPP